MRIKTMLGVGLGGGHLDPAGGREDPRARLAEEAIQDHGGTIVARPNPRLLASGFSSLESLMASARQLSIALGEEDGDDVVALAAALAANPGTFARLLPALLPTSVKPSANSARLAAVLPKLYGTQFVDMLKVAGQRTVTGRNGVAMIGALAEVASPPGTRWLGQATRSVPGVTAPVRTLALGAETDATPPRRPSEHQGGAAAGGSGGSGETQPRGGGNSPRGESFAVSGGPREARGTGTRGGSLLGTGGERSRHDGDRGAPPRVRHLAARFADRVRLGDEVTLQARVALAPQSDASATLAPFDVPPEGVDVLITLHSPGFTVLEADEKPVCVPPSADSSWVRFRLRATETGIHQLSVSCYAPAGFVGELPLDVHIGPDVATGNGLETKTGVPSPQPRSPSGGGELSLVIERSAGGYACRLIEGLNMSPAESMSLGEAPRKAIEDLVAKLNRLARGTSGHSATSAQRLLRAEGNRLWNDIFPPALKRQFWARRDRIRQLYIRADHDLVPWELLYPLDPDDRGRDFGFLAEQFPIAHLPFGPATTDRLRIHDAHFVAPANSPPRAVAEIQALRQRFAQAGGPHRPDVRDPNRLFDVLESADFDVLHFACHNQVSAGDPATISIDFDGLPFEPVLLEPLTRRLGARAPLVFLNACRTVSEQPRYVQAFGWASGFLAAGAGAFVGTAWEVRDVAAHRFAEHFYDQLLSTTDPPRTLGDVFHAARLSIKDDDGDPTWLAYALYGNLGATILREAAP